LVLVNLVGGWVVLLVLKLAFWVLKTQAATDSINDLNMRTRGLVRMCIIYTVYVCVVKSYRWSDPNPSMENFEEASNCCLRKLVRSIINNKIHTTPLIIVAIIYHRTVCLIRGLWRYIMYYNIVFLSDNRINVIKMLDKHDVTRRRWSRTYNILAWLAVVY
jgi:hypothetical protein